jgi:ABC-type multidrug transport system fused ATPase/permease subunit
MSLFERVVCLSPGRRHKKWRDLFRYARNGDSGEPSNTESDVVSLQSLLRFWKFVRQHRGCIALLCFVTLINQAMSIALPMAIGSILDRVMPQHNNALIFKTALAVAAFLAVRSLLLFVERELSVRAGWYVVLDVRRRLHRHLHSMSLHFLESYQVGRIINRLLGDTEMMRHLLLGGFINTLSNLAKAVLILLALFWIDWRLALISCFTLPFFLAGFTHFVTKLRDAYKEMNDDCSELWAQTNQSFAAARVVKICSRERCADIDFVRRLHLIFRKMLLVDRVQHVIGLIWEFTSGAGLVALVWYGAYRVQSGGMTVGDFFAFYSLLGLVHGPLADIIRNSGNIQHALASVERIDSVLTCEPEIGDRPGAIEAESIHGHIEFRNVGFRYKEPRQMPDEDETHYSNGNGNGNGNGNALARPALSGVNFTVSPGECIALVGRSGSGKSTLVNLLSRLYDVDDGAVLIDGVDIRNYRLTSFRRHFGIVLQETVLFDATIRDNIRYIRPHASEAEIVNAAKMANAWEFITELPDGLNAYCGERGVRLSGGQKQRLAIARAILADPRILILDEATSALDSEAESRVQEALLRLMRGRTTFMIAHRLSTIMHAGRIFVLDNGRVVAMGTHESLMAQESLYYEMFMRQYRFRSSRRLREV